MRAFSDPEFKVACDAWPGIDVPSEVFKTYVEARSSADLGTPEHLADLYLACACVHGVTNAVPRLLETHREAIEVVARRVGLSGEARDDLVQILSERLFVATANERPKIAQYTGVGPLRAWVKAVATRIALDLVRRGPRDKPGGGRRFDEDGAASDAAATDDTDEVLVARIADAPDVRLEKESDKSHLRAALRSSFASLSSQERNLLRYALLDGLSIDELARIYQIHRATAARRLVGSRDRLAEGVKQYLRSSLNLDESACLSLVKGGLSQVDLTLRTMSADRESA